MPSSGLNPWVDGTPAKAPYVLAQDAAGASGYELHKLPCPWSGPAFTATVIVLLLNPGYAAEQDRLDLLRPDFVTLARDQLTSGLEPFEDLGSADRSNRQPEVHGRREHG